MTLQKILIRLTEEQPRSLSDIALRDHISIAAQIRELISNKMNGKSYRDAGNVHTRKVQKRARTSSDANLIAVTSELQSNPLFLKMKARAS